MARLTREQSRKITIEKLRRAALKDFAKFGFSGATVDRISSSAGFSRGAFYANYKGKDDIMLDLLHMQKDLEMERWASLLDQAEDMETIYAGMAQDFRRYITTAEWSMFFLEARLHAKRSKKFAVAYEVYRQDLSDQGTKLMGYIFKKAGKTHTLSMQSIANLLTALVFGMSLAVDANADEQHVDESMDQLIVWLRNMVDSGTPL